MLHQSPTAAEANANPFPNLTETTVKFRDPYAGYRVRQMQDSFDSLYRKKKIHPGGSFKFSCHVRADMSRDDMQRHAGGKPWHAVIVVPTAFTRDGNPLASHVALFVVSAS